MSNPVILCATDLEAGSMAPALAIAVAKSMSADVEFLHVVSDIPDTSEVPESVSAGADAMKARLEERRAAATAQLEELCAKALAEGVACAIELRSGHPWEAVLERARESGVSLVVLSRRHDDTGFLGHTIDHVLRRVSCPVFVAPAKSEIPPDLANGRWLVGVDFSEHARTALRAVAAIVGRAGGEVHLTNVVTPPVGGEDASYEQQSPAQILRQQGREEAAKQLNELVATDLEGAEVVQRVTLGLPADELCAAADEVNADFLALGTHGRSGLSRVFLGSTAERLLRRSARPVLIIRNEPRARVGWFEPAGDGGHVSPNKVLVAVDFSDVSRRALSAGKELAAGLGIDMSVVYVHEPLTDVRRGFIGALPPSLSVEAIDQATVRDLRAQLRELVETEVGSEIGAEVVVGRPVQGIIEHAEAHGVDLVICGTTGKSGLTRLLLGSTAEKLVRDCPVPVLAVH